MRYLIVSILFWYPMISGCKPDTCHKSEVISVTHCSYSHDGTSCINRFKNRRFDVGQPLEVGSKHCTKHMMRDGDAIE